MTMPPPPAPPAPEPADAPLPQYGSPAPRRSGIAIAALVLGIVSVVVAILPVVFGLAFPIAITGVVLGIIALVKHRPPRGFSIAGLALSALGFVIAMIMVIVAVVQLAGALGELDGTDLSGGASSESAEPFPLDDEPVDDEPVEEAPPAADDMMLGFGEALTYTDGVTLSVSAPAEFAPTEYAAGADQASNLVFTFTLVNDSGANLEPYTFAQVASGGVESSRIFDSGNAAGDISTSPSTVILPGGSVTWQEAYSVADPANLVVQVSPGFDYEDAIFTNVQ